MKSTDFGTHLSNSQHYGGSRKKRTEVTLWDLSLLPLPLLPGFQTPINCATPQAMTEHLVSVGTAAGGVCGDFCDTGYRSPIRRNLCTSRDSIAVKTPEWKQKEGLIGTEAQVPLLLSLNTQALLPSLFIERFLKLLSLDKLGGLRC